jgi:DNA polymerase I-like protein with 3'-5' exonuclease and polymerase domains
MENKAFIQQRIGIYIESEFNPNDDKAVVSTLRDKFNIQLPQRSALNDSLAATASTHEIVELILKFRTMDSL